MPLKSFSCRICGADCPRDYLVHGRFASRMRWLRRHYREKHPEAARRAGWLK